MNRPVRRLPGHRLIQSLYRLAPVGRPAFAAVRPFLRSGELFAIPFDGGHLLSPSEWLSIGSVHEILGGLPFANPELLVLEIAKDAIARRDGILIDVGAAVGAYDLWLRHRFAKRIIAFEPSPISARLLAEVVRFNRLEDVEIRQVACDAKAGGVLSLALGPNSAAIPDARVTDGGSIDWLDSAVISQADGSSLVVHVPVTTLDMQLRAEGPDHEKVAFMKIDVEGMELRVLEGCAQTIERQKPILWLEGHPTLIGRFGRTIDDLYRRLAEWGYGTRTWIEERPAGHLARVISRVGGRRCREIHWEALKDDPPAQIFILAQ